MNITNSKKKHSLINSKLIESSDLRNNDEAIESIKEDISEKIAEDISSNTNIVTELKDELSKKITSLSTPELKKALRKKYLKSIKMI